MVSQYLCITDMPECTTNTFGGVLRGRGECSVARYSWRVVSRFRQLALRLWA